MITKKTALKEAGRLAAALGGPLGPRPMQPVICEFLPFFRDLRSSGGSWSQITALLAAAGVRSASGQPLTEGVLRAMVSRAERKFPVPVGDGKKIAREAERRIHTRLPDTSPPPRSAMPRTRGGDDHAVLTDVAERIRRASALRGQS